MSEETPKLIFEYKIVLNSGVYRIGIPPVIVKALGLEKGDTLQIALEGRKIIYWKKEN